MLFFISLLMVFVSSYLTACVASPRTEDNKPYGPAPFLYTLLIMFAQIVLTFEVLSLFKAITEINVLVFNILFLTASAVLWFKNNKPVYIPAVKEKFQEIFKALKRDKILMIIFDDIYHHKHSKRVNIVCSPSLNVYLKSKNYTA